MEKLSNKAKVVYATLEQLGAIDKENKVTSYAILDYIIEESEELYKHELVKDIPEQEFVDITLDINLKSISATLTPMVKKNLINSTDPTTIKVNGTNRNLKQYFLNKK